MADKPSAGLSDRYRSSTARKNHPCRLVRQVKKFDG
jgi:hypothetical protein